VCVGETEAAAQDKRSIIEGTAREIDALVLLSEVLNYDFASKPAMSSRDSSAAAPSASGCR
jgi:hypothetical protein